MITLSLLLLSLRLLGDPTAVGDPAAAAGAISPFVESFGPTESDGPPGSSFRYRYAEGAILLGDFDGIRLGGSWPIEGPWIALGRLDYLTEDEGSTDVDLLLLSGGAGYVHTLEDERVDLIGSAEIEFGEADVDGPGGSADDDDLGIRLRGGARFQANDKIELAGGLSFSTIFDEEVGLDGQALYAFDERFSGFIGFDHRDDTVLTIGVRYTF